MSAVSDNIKNFSLIKEQPGKTFSDILPGKAYDFVSDQIYFFNNHSSAVALRGGFIGLSASILLKYYHNSKSHNTNENHWRRISYMDAIIEGGFLGFTTSLVCASVYQNYMNSSTSYPSTEMALTCLAGASVSSCAGVVCKFANETFDV